MVIKIIHHSAPSNSPSSPLPTFSHILKPLLQLNSTQSTVSKLISPSFTNPIKKHSFFWQLILLFFTIFYFSFLEAVNNSKNHNQLSEVLTSTALLSVKHSAVLLLEIISPCINSMASDSFVQNRDLKTD